MLVTVGTVYATACWCKAGDTFASRLAPAARGCKGISSSSICCLAKFTKTCVRKAENVTISSTEMSLWNVSVHVHLLGLSVGKRQGICRHELRHCVSAEIVNSFFILINFLATSFLWMHLLVTKILLLKQKTDSARFAWLAQHE